MSASPRYLRRDSPPFGITSGIIRGTMILKLEHTGGRSKMKIRTMDDARRANTTGWFAPDAMRWFDTRIESMLYVGPGGAFFVTSEQPPGDVRVFTVRQVHDNGDVETVGEFGRYETADGARGIAAGLAEGTIA